MITCSIASDSILHLSVNEIDFRTDKRWAEFVCGHPDASVFHHPGWIEALENEYGRRCISLACEDPNGQLLGILPLFRTSGLPFGLGPQRLRPRLSSLPRTPTAGPLTSRLDVTLLLMRAAMRELQQEEPSTLEIKTQTRGLDSLMEGIICVPWRMTYLKELPEYEDEIRFGDARNQSRIRWSVNKANRLGVHVRLAESYRDLNAWYQIYLRTMRAKAVPARPYRFFESLWRNLSSNGTMQLLLAERYQNSYKKLVAGTVLLTFRDTMFYAFNGSRSEDHWLRPNDILQWTAIHEACRRGCRWYDLGEVPESHVHLADFKRKWGARQERLYRYYYPGDIDGSGKSWNADNANHLVGKVWPRLPLRLTAWLGDKIYRYL